MASKLLCAYKTRTNLWATVSQKEALIRSRNFASKAKQASQEDPCPERACKKKRSIWNIFKKQPKREPEKPPIQTCKKYLAKKRWEPDPDLSEFGGTPYRTCGPAYIIQKDQLPKETTVTAEPEDRILERIERHPDLKNVVDPMPPFESVEQRLIDLSEKKLHPLYKRYLSLPKRTKQLSSPKFVYKSRSGPISPDEIPSHLKINKHCLEQKNIYSEFKRVEPPRQLLAKMVEMKQNERPTLGKKNEPCPCTDPPNDVDVSRVLNTK